MKNLAKFSLTLLSAGLLAACGSSGGDNNNSSNSNTQATPTNSVANQQNAAQNQAAPANSVANQQNATQNQATPVNSSDNQPKADTQNQATSANSSANQSKADTQNQATPTNQQNNQTNKAASTQDDDLGDAFRIKDRKDFDLDKTNNHAWETELVVDGKRLPIAPATSNGFTKASGSEINGVRYDQLAVSGLKYSDVKFGVIDGYVFAQGNVTPDSEIPTTGKATYSVDGVLVLNGEVKTSEGNTLTADFANKTINGSVFKGWTVTDAKIEGNEFSGEVVCPKGYKGELDGHFYGENANEIGGAYSSAGYSGAFGGKKQ